MLQCCTLFHYLRCLSPASPLVWMIMRTSQTGDLFSYIELWPYLGFCARTSVFSQTEMNLYSLMPNILWTSAKHSELDCWTFLFRAFTSCTTSLHPYSLVFMSTKRNLVSSLSCSCSPLFLAWDREYLLNDFVIWFSSLDSKPLWKFRKRFFRSFCICRGQRRLCKTCRSQGKALFGSLHTDAADVEKRVFDKALRFETDD